MSLKLPKAASNKSLLKLITAYKHPSKVSAVWQIANTIVPYVMLWVAMWFALQVSWWLVLPLSILAAGFMVRLFIIFHDCGHGAFFPDFVIATPKLELPNI